MPVTDPEPGWLVRYDGDLPDGWDRAGEVIALVRDDDPEDAGWDDKNESDAGEDDDDESGAAPRPLAVTVEFLTEEGPRRRDVPAARLTRAYEYNVTYYDLTSTAPDQREMLTVRATSIPHMTSIFTARMFSEHGFAPDDLLIIDAVNLSVPY